MYSVNTNYNPLASYGITNTASPVTANLTTPLTNNYFSSQLQNTQIPMQQADTGVLNKFMDWLKGGGNSNTDLGAIGTGINNTFNALQALNAGWGLYSSMAQWGTQKALNREALANAKMKNESLRFEIDNRKQEIARWNQVRSNVHKHLQNTSQIKTSY